MERKLGEIFTLPDGRRVRVDARTGVDCRGCALTISRCLAYIDIVGECGFFYRSDRTNVIFTDITSGQPAPSSAPNVAAHMFVNTPVLAEAFNAEIIEAAREAFVYRFWDYPNTRLAEIMNVSEATVRRIRKKRLQKNRTQE